MVHLVLTQKRWDSWCSFLVAMPVVFLGEFLIFTEKNLNNRDIFYEHAIPYVIYA
jgi:hypothetical protein